MIDFFIFVLPVSVFDIYYLIILHSIGGLKAWVTNYIGSDVIIIRSISHLEQVKSIL